MQTLLVLLAALFCLYSADAMLRHGPLRSLHSCLPLWAARSAPTFPLLNFGVSPAVAEELAGLNELKSLKGVGPKTLQVLAQLGIRTVTDLVLHFPKGIIDRSEKVDLSEELLGEIVTAEGTVEKVKEGFRGAPCVVHGRDNKGTRFTLTYFFGKTQAAAYLWSGLKKSFFPGAQIVFSGRLTKSAFTSYFDVINPDFALEAGKGAEKFLVVEPKYGLTDGLTSTKMRSLIRSALDMLFDPSASHSVYFSEDWLPLSTRDQFKWPTMKEALLAAHSPQSLDSLSVTSAWRQRLAFDEFVAMQIRQLKVQFVKDQEATQMQVGQQHVVKGTGELSEILIKQLPFKLTNCQRAAVHEIWEQLGKPERMVRCVQGDVGSGKTLVAVLAMLRAVEDGKQAALLAPTEILAKQHMSTISKYFEIIRKHSKSELLPTVELITGGVRGSARDEILKNLSAGKISVLVGTHALLSDSVASSFSSLGLVCIDEEQRFGVNQRDALGDRSNVLYTTATPIPRSLMMAVTGSAAGRAMTISTLNEKPPAKRPVQTILIGVSYVDRVIERLRANIPFGSKVFWVTPS